MDVVLLRESFNLVAPDKEKFAEAFYERLFTTFPHTRQLFAKADMKQQQAALMSAIALVVAGVEKGDNLAPVLRALGERHEKYGVKPEHYALVGQALLETFGAFLGPQWTSAYLDTWTQAYTVVSQGMIG